MANYVRSLRQIPMMDSKFESNHFWAFKIHLRVVQQEINFFPCHIYHIFRAILNCQSSEKNNKLDENFFFFFFFFSFSCRQFECVLVNVYKDFLKQSYYGNISTQIKNRENKFFIRMHHVEWNNKRGCFICCFLLSFLCSHNFLLGL